MASQEELDRAREIRDIESDRVGISSELLQNLRDSSNAVSDQVSQLQFEKQEKGDIRSITRDLNKIAKDNFTLGLKELGTGKNIAKIQKDQAKLQSSILAASQLRDQFSESTVESEFELAIALEAQIKEAKKLSAELAVIEEESSNIAKNFGVKPFDVSEDIVASIPGLRQFSGSFKAAANSARSVAAAGGTSSKAFAAGAKSLASSAKAALPLLILTEVIEAFIRLDAGAGKIAKQLGVSYQESLKLQSSFNQIANASGNIFVNTEKITAQFLAINDALGTRASLEGKLLVFANKLSEQAGIQQGTINKIALLTGDSGEAAEEFTNNFLGAARALNFTEGILINEKALLNDIAKISSNILATFADNPNALAAASFEAKRLGIDLNRLQGVANSLLDVETSLKNEFMAEALLGRQLNLIRARELALRKDYAGVGKEILNQGISLDYYSGLGIIKQEALATSFGMTNDELADSLLLNERLNELGLQDEKAARDKFELLKKTRGEQFAINELGAGALAQQLASTSQSEKFNASVNKLKEVFTGVVSALMPIFDVFVSIVGVVGNLLQILDPVIQLLNVVANLNNDLLSAGAGVVKAAFQTRSGNAEGASQTLSQINFERTKGAANQFGTSVDNAVESAVPPDFYSGISNAVEAGASRANINLDGGRVSKRLSAPLAIDTRKYSY